MRPPIDRVVYPAVRPMTWQLEAEASPPPNFWSLDADQRAWVARGKGFSMHRADRTYYKTQKPASATDFYNTDQSSKMSVTHKVQRSPYRYVGMRAESAHNPGAYLGFVQGTPEAVGPGSYQPHAFRIERSEDSGSSAFGSQQPRTAENFMVRGRTAEPGYSTLETDLRLWQRHANGQVKGRTFACAQRWKRPPGPGSNLPGEKLTPGPGAYGKLHSWPGGGFKGTARGFNHNLGA